MTYTKDLAFPTTIRPFTDVLDRFLGELDPFNGGTTLKHITPRVNIIEDEKAYQLEVQAPGFAKEDLKLNLEQDVLTIRGEKEQRAQKESGRYTRREFASQAFSRSFRLPELVDSEGIRADHVDGVLSITLPKKAAVKPATKQISIG
ncbi:MAG: Hsp20/alpha crystallin family protein [Flavobacteriales bacterium]|nr:Hsp20/alpha crystallin family protein [Flavobacteriales bacterium]MBP9079712.1 Hsp20/alpha crystallin family protein [Flavobacteriales bacterium]